MNVVLVAHATDFAFALRAALAASLFVHPTPKSIYIVTDISSLLEEHREQVIGNGFKLIDENDERFGFTRSDVSAVISWCPSRIGWYYQQLLKLYAWRVLPEDFPRYLVIDADTVFFRPVSFVLEDGRTLLTQASEHWSSYFSHMAKLYPTLRRVIPNVSGVAHHMLFDRYNVNSLMRIVESHHSDVTNKPFWRIFLDCVERDASNTSGASEYETYLNFCLLHCAQSIRVRSLKWTNGSRDCPDCPTSAIESLSSEQCRGFRDAHLPNHYYSFHHYMRTKDERGLLCRIDDWLEICKVAARGEEPKGA